MDIPAPGQSKWSLKFHSLSFLHRAGISAETEPLHPARQTEKDFLEATCHALAVCTPPKNPRAGQWPEQFGVGVPPGLPAESAT